MPRGGYRPGAGRKPGSTKAAKVTMAQKALEAIETVAVDEDSIAGEILLDIDFREQYRKIFRMRGNHATKARLLTHLLDKCTGRAFTAQNPIAAKPKEDPRIAAAIKELLPPARPQAGAAPETDPKKIM